MNNQHDILLCLLALSAGDLLSYNICTIVLPITVLFLWSLTSVLTSQSDSHLVISNYIYFVVTVVTVGMRYQITKLKLYPCR